MKKKYLFMLPAISFATGTSAFAQDTASVPAASKVNMKAEFSEAKPAKEMFDQLADLITKFAKEEGEDIDGKAVLNALGLNEVNSYAMSSKKNGNLWDNHLFLHNKGSEKGIFALLGKKNAKFTVPNVAPADSDLAFQLELDLKTVEKLIGSVMTAANAPADVKEEFKKAMAEKTPLGITTSELLAKMDVRLNVVMDLDPTVKLALPMVGQIDTPNLLIRMDGVAWAVKQLAPDLIAESGLPLNKTEVDGVTTYSLPAEMAAQFLGYSPVFTVDSNTDQVTIASTTEFLAKCTGATPKLAQSADFKAASEGFPVNANGVTYVSQEFAKFSLRLMEIAKASGLLEQMGGNEKAQFEKAIDLFKKIDTDLYAGLSKTDDGMHFFEKSVQDMETKIKDSKEQIEELMKQL